KARLHDRAALAIGGARSPEPHLLNPFALLSSPYGIAYLVLIGVCIVHAVRAGNVFPWVYIIIFLPGIGSLIYLFAIIVPELFRSRAAARFARSTRTIADPHRSLRQAARAHELVGSVDSKRALAEEYLLRGAYKDAADIYAEAAQGQFRTIPPCCSAWRGPGSWPATRRRHRPPSTRSRPPTRVTSRPMRICSMPARWKGRTRRPTRWPNTAGSSAIIPARRRAHASPCCWRRPVRATRRWMSIARSSSCSTARPRATRRRRRNGAISPGARCADEAAVNRILSPAS